MSQHTNTIAQVRAPINYKNEFVAAASTYLTMSYIFVLNPTLLAKAGINISAAFVATIVAAFCSTMAMGLYAKLPYVVAPAPTVTTFFVFYVCQTMGFSWQEALTAVLVSGLLSVGATLFSIREKLVRHMPEAIRIAIMFAIGGFLVANGLALADIIPYGSKGIILNKVSFDRLLTPQATIAISGFIIALIFNSKWFTFKAGPLLALIIATIIASKLGFEIRKPTFRYQDMFSSMGQLDVAVAFKPDKIASFWFAAFIFFVVDFYGAIGKFVGLYEMTKTEVQTTNDEDKQIGAALYVDSWGTVVGALLGTSSVAVFISSCVAVMSGGKYGVTAVFCALLILLSALLVPLIGSIPTVVNAGILIYIGSIFMPWERVGRLRKVRGGVIHIAIALAAGLVSLATFGIDKGLFVAFALGCAMLLYDKGLKQDGASGYLFVTAILLGVSVVAQMLLLPA